MNLADYPLKVQIHLSESRLQECFEETRHILQSCDPCLSDSDWYSEEWLKNVLRRAPEEFDRAFDRWRELYRAAMTQLQESQQVFYECLLSYTNQRDYARLNRHLVRDLLA